VWRLFFVQRGPTFTAIFCHGSVIKKGLSAEETAMALVEQLVQPIPLGRLLLESTTRRPFHLPVYILFHKK